MKQFKERSFLEKYDKYFFFYTGYLSNWANTPFTDTQTDIRYSCSEQFMMHKKALLFGDGYIAEKILESNHPKVQKALGREVKGFDKETWDFHARQIVYEGCFYKFKQNREAYDYLMGTRGHYLVEASPYDTVWGIGLGCNDEKAGNPENWRGTNWLGQVLTALREDFEGD